MGLNENALLHITLSINKLMNGEVQITDLVICKLLLQNIEEYRSYFHRLQQLLDWTFQELLLVVEIISNMSTQIQIILSHYIESLLLNSYRLKTMTKRNIWKCSSILLRPYSQYLDLVAHSKGLKKREPTIDGMRYINNVSKIFSQQKRSYKMGVYRWVYFRTKQRISKLWIQNIWQ